MNWLSSFRPTKSKAFLSLVPFIFPLFQVWLTIQIAYDLYLDVGNIFFDAEEIIVGLLYIAEVNLAAPFESILEALGWWSRNSLVVAPEGPLLPGSFAVAIFYSLVIYIVWSLIGAWRHKRQTL
jgi:hypothetical protein